MMTSDDGQVGDLEVDSVRFAIAGRSILTNVYLKVKVGEVVGLLGRNGCGKSTLLKIIFGSQKAESKNIRIGVARLARPFRSSLISYLPQGPFVPPGLRISKIAEKFLPAAGMAEFERIERIKGLLDREIGSLSGGNRRYVEVMLILNLRSRFVLLDEPFAEIEPILREQMLVDLKEKSATKGIIITDHDYRRIILASDRLILLSGGRTIPIKDAEELRDYHYISAGTKLQGPAPP